MAKMKFPLSRRERYVLKKIFELHGTGDDGSLGSSRANSRRGSRIYNPPSEYGAGGTLPPQSPAPSSVFLPSNGAHDASLYSAAPDEISMPPTIPPSVPSEYQFQWPPPQNMAPIYEESFIGAGAADQYEYKYDASMCDVLWVIFGIVVYALDIVFDVLVAVWHFKNGDYWWFALTVAFLAVPAVIMTIFSLVLYIRDLKIMAEKASPLRWTARAVFLTLQLGPLLRLLDTVRFACRSRRVDAVGDQQHFFERMVDEDVDAALLRLVAAFLQAAPQAVLQLYILTAAPSNNAATVSLQVLSVVTSLISMATIMVSFSKCLRQSQKTKAKLGKCAMFAQFLWRFFTIGTRIVAFAMFASYFTYFVFVIAGIHYIIMLVWLTQQHTMYCVVKTTDGKETHSKLSEFTFQAMAAFVHVFCFFNVLEGHTRLRALLYYTITYIENSALVLAWFIAKSNALYSYHGNYEGPVVGIVMGGFWAGIAFMLMYYKCCHPNNNSPFEEHMPIKWCVKFNDMSCCYDKDKQDPAVSRALTRDELEHMAAAEMSYEKPETVKSFGPRRCVDPVPKTDHNTSMSSYRPPQVYDSYVQLNTSRQSNTLSSSSRSQKPPSTVQRSIAYKEPQTLESLLNTSTTV